MVRRTKEDADATRNSLLDAAERVFHEKGVSGASLSDIAHAAGATRGAIYWHFKDKVDLFNAMMDRVTLPLEQACGENDCTAGMPALQRLRAIVDFVLRSVAEDDRTRRVFEVAMYRVEYVGELMPVRDRHIAACGNFLAQIERDLLAAAADQGIALPMAPRLAATGLHALFDGLLQGWLLNNTDFDLVATGHVTVDAYLRGLGFDLQSMR